MFWGVTLESGKRYSQVVDTSYHLSMAALEPRQGGEPVMVMLEHGKAEFLLCTLDQGNTRQMPLDLCFVEGEEVTFFLNGKGTVHLTGYLTDGLQDDDESSDEEVSLPDEEEEDQENELNMGDHEPQKPSKRSKKAKKLSTPMLVSSSNPVLAFNGESEDESDTDFDVDQVEDETEDDTDEESSEEEDPQPLSLVQPKRSPQKRSADKALGNATPSGEKRALTPSTSPGDTVAKKKRRRSKKQRSETPTADSDNAQGQALPQAAARAAHTQEDKGAALTQLPGGVVSSDLRVGSGPPAKPGRVMHVYYTGRLSNNKVFDSCTSGKAFSFRLGKNEVIKGWDTGIRGMKVGGKRRLVIPPSQGYGNSRMGAIPPNSTLFFDVELKAVS